MVQITENNDRPENGLEGLAQVCMFACWYADNNIARLLYYVHTYVHSAILLLLAGTNFSDISEEGPKR